MKKLLKFGFTALVILAVAFTACPSEENPNKDNTIYEFNLTVENIAVAKANTAQQKALSFLLTSDPAGGTTTGSYSLECRETACGCGVTLVTSGMRLNIPANINEGTYNYKLTYIRNGNTVASADFSLTVVDLGDFGFGFVLFEEMTVYRIGSSAAQRTINFILYDDEYFEPVLSQGIRSLVQLEVIDNGGLEIEKINNNLIVKEDKTLEPGEYSVEISIKFNGENKENDFILITVEKLLLDVKFYNGNSEITSLGLTVESGELVTNPGNPDLAGFSFDNWYSNQQLTVEFDFNNAITANTNIYGKFESVSNEYNITLTVTLGNNEAAQVKEDEQVWVAGNFWVQTGQNPPWDIHQLQKVNETTWSSILTAIPNSNTDFEYQVYVFPSTPTGLDDFYLRGVKAQLSNITVSNVASTKVINYTVTQWHRPKNMGDNIFQDGDFNTPGSGWALNSLPADAWRLTGSSENNRGNIWLTANPPSTSKSFWDRNGTNTRYYQLNVPFEIYQDVSVSGNGFEAGDRVTMSINLGIVTRNHSNVIFICGEQTQEINVESHANSSWVVYSHTFTLTEADVAGETMKAGFGYTITNNNGGTMIDYIMLTLDD